MRRIAVFLILCAALSCTSEHLTGADARRAVAEGKLLFSVIPDSIAVFVDNVRQPSGTPLTVRNEAVQSIEIVKGAAAKALLGPDAVGGAIYIYTKRTR